MLSFFALLTLDAFLVAIGASWVGVLGAVAAAGVLYWRIRGGHIASSDPDLHGLGLRSRSQRAFTALMLRHALTGRNALQTQPRHDPMRTWAARVQSSEEA